MSTAEKIRLPDDCTIGYIIESVLGVKLIRSNLFHSHLENLHQVPKSEIHKQVSPVLTPWGGWRGWGWTVPSAAFMLAPKNWASRLGG